MLSTPDLTDLPDQFKRYFARSADLLLTGHFYTETLTYPTMARHDHEESTFTVIGLKTSDVVVVNLTSYVAELVIANAWVSATNTLSIAFSATDTVTTGSASFDIVAIRRERE